MIQAHGQTADTGRSTSPPAVLGRSAGPPTKLYSYTTSTRFWGWPCGGYSCSEFAFRALSAKAHPAARLNSLAYATSKRLRELEVRVQLLLNMTSMGIRFPDLPGPTWRDSQPPTACKSDERWDANARQALADLAHEVHPGTASADPRPLSKTASRPG